MRTGLATVGQRGAIGRLLGYLPLAFVGIMVLCTAENAAVVPAATAAPDLQKPPEQQAPPSAEQDPLLTAARKKVLVQLLDQLQQQTREAEASLKQAKAGTDGQIILADVQALHERVQNVQQELNHLTRVGPGPGGGSTAQIPTPAQELQRLDERTQELTRQREDLARTVRQLETQLQQLPASQEAGRRWLQGEITRIRGQLRNVDEQLAQVQQERLRADYGVALHARAEQEREREEAGRAAATAKQVADLSAQLKQLQEQAQRNQQELEQIQDRSGPQARALEKSIEGVRQQIQTIQDQLRQTERERAVEKLQAADRQRQTLDAYVQELGRCQDELKQSVEAIRQDLRTMQQQMQQQVRAASDESVRRTAEQGLEQLRAESLRQQEELRNQIRILDERLQTTTERAGTGTEAFRKELDSLRTDMQRMGWTIGRLERERLDAQASLQSQVQQLEHQVSDLHKDVALVQGTLNMMLSQMGRSTVGTAGCTWGW